MKFFRSLTLPEKTLLTKSYFLISTNCTVIKCTGRGRSVRNWVILQLFRAALPNPPTPQPPTSSFSNVAIFQPVSKGDFIFEKSWEMLGEILFLIKIWSCGAKEMIENIGKDLSPSFPWGNWDQNIARNMSSWRRLEVQSIIQVWFTELSTSRSLLIFLFIFLEEQAHISKRRSWRVFWETRKWGDERDLQLGELEMMEKKKEEMYNV